MKTVIVKQNGVPILELRRTKKGVDLTGLTALVSTSDITVVLGDNSLVRFPATKLDLRAQKNMLKEAKKQEESPHG